MTTIRLRHKNSLHLPTLEIDHNKTKIALNISNKVKLLSCHNGSVTIPQLLVKKRKRLNLSYKT